MTNDQQQIARAFETLSDRLSKELDDAFNQMAQLGRVLINFGHIRFVPITTAFVADAAKDAKGHLQTC
jgi:hypothetical protein